MCHEVMRTSEERRQTWSDQLLHTGWTQKVCKMSTSGKVLSDSTHPPYLCTYLKLCNLTPPTHIHSMCRYVCACIRMYVQPPQQCHCNKAMFICSRSTAKPSVTWSCLSLTLHVSTAKHSTHIIAMINSTSQASPHPHQIAQVQPISVLFFKAWNWRSTSNKSTLTEH